MKIFSVHISSLISHIATAMLLLRVKIWPRKCHSNLTQLIIFRLLRGCSPPRSQPLHLERCSINDGIRNVQKKALIFCCRVFMSNSFLSAPFVSSSLRNQKSTQPVFSNPQKITCIIFENLFGPYFLPHQLQPVLEGANFRLRPLGLRKNEGKMKFFRVFLGW